MNIPLAVTEGTLFGQLTIPMAPGDRLVVYTDGIIDTPGPEGVCFGLERLKDVLDANTGVPLSELKSAVLKTLHQYSGKELTHDDVTLIALEIC
jgi:serine phosphatase RsbU (regulator of sigma subunit)